MDLVTHVRLKPCTQLGSRVRDLEAAAAYCTLFPPKENDMVKEMQDAGRFCNDMVENKPDVERGSPHIWFFVAMLKATEKMCNKQEREWRTEPSRSGESGGNTDAQNKHRQCEGPRAEPWDKSMQAFSNLRKAGTTT